MENLLKVKEQVKIIDAAVKSISSMALKAHLTETHINSADILMTTVANSLVRHAKSMVKIESELKTIYEKAKLDKLVEETRNNGEAERTAILLHPYPELAFDNSLDINLCYPWSIIVLCQKHIDLVGKVDVDKMNNAVGLAARNHRRYYDPTLAKKWVALRAAYGDRKSQGLALPDHQRRALDKVAELPAKIPYDIAQSSNRRN